MTHVTCRLTAKNRDQLRNPTLGNRVWATFTFFARLTRPGRPFFSLVCTVISYGGPQVFVQRPHRHPNHTTVHLETFSVVWLWRRCGLPGLRTKVGTYGPPLLAELSRSRRQTVVTTVARASCILPRLTSLCVQLPTSAVNCGTARIR